MLSSKTTDIYDYSKQNTVVSSNVSAGEIAISSKKDTNITGSNVVADNDVSVKAGGNLNIGSSEQTSESEYIKSVKKSGILSGGGLGFTIGKEKQKDQYANQNIEQVGSTVGSVKGNVNLNADKAANVKGSSVVAGKDINITGENVKIENSDSIYNAQEKHEFKRTGLSVSVGGEAVNKVSEVVNHVERANQVNDKRLAALHGYKVVESVEKNIGMLKDAVKNPSQGLSLNVSVGSSQSKSESKSTTVVANASEVKAEGNVQITSTEKDINITGSNVEGKDVTLNAKENLNITASKNTNNTEQSSKSSSVSIGASLELGRSPSYSISGSMSKGEVSANGTTYNESNVTANKDLNFASGKGTNIKGGKLSGEKVTGNIGGDLNIESKQDSNSYKENNKSIGVSIGLGSNKAVSGSASVGKIDSNYKSVTDQSGVYAGEDGFDIRVETNTDLKGGIISSTADADKNKLSTGTLTFEDIQNKADYKAGGAGIKVNKNNDADYNEKGITPDIGMPASGEAESTTKATISKGTIEIRDKENQKQDINKLNRDNANSLNKLGEILDKTKIEERQKLANLFGELAYNEIHYMDGSNEQKALYHAVVGGIMSKLTGGDFLAGASAAGINKLVIEEIDKVVGGDPDKAQWVSAALGAVISGLVSGNVQAGASTAASGTKNNFYQRLTPFKKIIEKIKNEGLLDRLADDEYYVINIDIGTDISTIARMLGMSVSAIKKINSLEGSIGIIIDKNGGVYDTDGISVSAGIGKFTNNTEMNIADSPYGITLAIGHIPQYIRGMQYKEYLTGGSASLNMSILGIYAGTAFSGELEDLNISLDTGVNSSFDNSISLGISNADYVGNIFNSNIFDKTYEYNQHIKDYIAVENLDGVNFYCDENGTIRLQKGEQLYAADIGRWENVRGVYKLINGWRKISLEETKKFLDEDNRNE